MPFEFDPTGSGDTSLPQLDKIQTQESAGDRQRARSVVRIDAHLCEDTGVCAQVCPEDVLEFRDGHTSIVDPQACTECWICVENCVSSAIDIG